MGKYFSMFSSKVEFEDEAKLNASALKHPGFKIAFCPDWRTTYDGKYVYFSNIMEYYRDIVELHGGRLIVLSFDCKIESYKDIIDGWMIPGGRDVDPKNYGQPNTASKFEPLEAEKRWRFCKQFLEGSHPEMPIFGVCYGFEVLNCLMGGDLVQNIPNPRSHYEVRTCKIKPESKLAKSTKVQEMDTVCFHHQGIGKLAPCFEATSWDIEDGIIHSFESKGNGRNIHAVLWHPEACYEGESISNHDKNNLAILESFFKDCKHYFEKKSQKNVRKLDSKETAPEKSE